MPEPTKALVERLFTEHYTALLAFFYRRVKRKSDASDLVQEVYLRMLRVNDANAIRNPEGYLYTVASNLAKEHAVLDRRQAGAIDADEVSAEHQLRVLPMFDSELDLVTRVSRLRAVLTELSPKCRAAVVMQYNYGLSYQEIADRLDVSPNMVKKYLAQALVHCRRRMRRLA
jgi:RNA polymerase sigma factor (sigma-70 family)